MNYGGKFMTPHPAWSPIAKQPNIPNNLAQVESELTQVRRAFLRASASGKRLSDEHIELLDAIEHNLEESRARGRRNLPLSPEETNVPLALLQHLSRSAQHFQNLR